MVMQWLQTQPSQTSPSAFSSRFCRQWSRQFLIITYNHQVSHRSTWAILPWSSVLFSWFVFTTQLANHNQMVIVIINTDLTLISIIVIALWFIESGTNSKLNSTFSWILPKTQKYIENRSKSNLAILFKYVFFHFFDTKLKLKLFISLLVSLLHRCNNWSEFRVIRANGSGQASSSFFPFSLPYLLYLTPLMFDDCIEWHFYYDS